MGLGGLLIVGAAICKLHLSWAGRRELGDRGWRDRDLRQGEHDKERSDEAEEVRWTCEVEKPGRRSKTRTWGTSRMQR